MVQEILLLEVYLIKIYNEIFKLFISGFLAYLALGKTHEEAIQAGSYCSFECIQQSGCTYPDKPNFDPKTFAV